MKLIVQWAIFERGELVRPRLLGQIGDRQPLTSEVLLDHLPVLDEHDRVAVESAPHPREPEGPPRSEHLQRGDRADRDDSARDRVVVLGQPLLNRVSEHDQQDQVEWLQRRQLAPPDHARQHVDEGEERDAAESEVHYG